MDWSRTQMDAQLVATTALEAELARAREVLAAIVANHEILTIGEHCAWPVYRDKAKSALTPGGHDGRNAASGFCEVHHPPFKECPCCLAVHQADELAQLREALRQAAKEAKDAGR